MSAIHDLRCRRCGRLDLDVTVRSQRYPRCPSCGSRRVPAFDGWGTVKTDIWGQSRWFNGIDQRFESRSDLRAYLKANHLEPCGDKEHGARNESHLGLGKSFSFAGQKHRGDNPLANRTVLK